MGHSSNNSEVALFRVEELFSALHHSGESQVTSHLIHRTLINPQRLKRSCFSILKSAHHNEVIYMNLINRVCFFSPEKCECVEVTLSNPKLFCAAEYDYGKNGFDPVLFLPHKKFTKIDFWKMLKPALFVFPAFAGTLQHFFQDQ